MTKLVVRNIGLFSLLEVINELVGGVFVRAGHGEEEGDSGPVGLVGSIVEFGFELGDLSWLNTVFDENVRDGIFPGIGDESIDVTEVVVEVRDRVRVFCTSFECPR